MRCAQKYVCSGPGISLARQAFREHSALNQLILFAQSIHPVRGLLILRVPPEETVLNQLIRFEDYNTFIQLIN